MANIVKKWLSEYKTLPESRRSSYAENILQNEELMLELYDLFEDDLSQEVVDPVCHQLFDFYRTLNIELQRFTMELVPVLMWTYLFAASYSDKKKCSGIEACLLGIYNLEVVDENGKPQVKSITIPSLASNSFFHEPPSLASLVLTESALSRYHSDVMRTVCFGPFPQLDGINAYNRLPVLTFIINRYNADIANVSTKSHEMICKVCSRLTRAGFERLDDSLPASIDQSEVVSNSINRGAVSFTEKLRIPLSSGLLVELLSAVYYAIFNGQARLGLQALEDIHWRASYELNADVLLVTNAVKNSLRFNPLGQLKDGPMGISIALSPTQGNLAFSKDAITNASFRARKLPEDIDVQDAGNQPVDSVEDGGDNDVGTGGLRSVSVAVPDTKSSPVQHKSTITSKGPLKSIMKKREKVQRKEPDLVSMSKRGSHFKEFLELHVSKSPSHSVSMSGMSSASVVNGDPSTHGQPYVADLNAVQLNVMRGNRQSLDADASRSSASRSSVVTSDSMDDAIYGRGTAPSHLTTPSRYRHIDADESMDSGPDADNEDIDEQIKNDCDSGRFDGQGTKL